MSRSSPFPETGASACSATPACGPALGRPRVPVRPQDGPAAQDEAAGRRGATGAAPRAGRPWPDAASVAAARRADAVASLAPLWLEGVDQEAVGAESRRSLHPVVRPALYVMSRVGCRPLRCAAADSNRLRPALALPGAIHVAWLQLLGLLPPWCTPDGDSPRPPALTRRGRLPSSPPGGRRRARGARGRARRPCDAERRRRRSASA